MVWSEAKLRQKIAEEVDEKLMYMHGCINERNTIQSIILHDGIPQKSQCDTCTITDCITWRRINLKDKNDLVSQNDVLEALDNLINQSESSVEPVTFNDLRCLRATIASIPAFPVAMFKEDV